MTDIDRVWCPHFRGNQDRLGAVTRNVPYLDDLDFPVFWLFSSLGAMSFGDTGNWRVWGKCGYGNGESSVHGAGNLCNHCCMGRGLHGVFLEPGSSHSGFYRCGSNLFEEDGGGDVTGILHHHWEWVVVVSWGGGHCGVKAGVDCLFVRR